MTRIQKAGWLAFMLILVMIPVGATHGQTPTQNLAEDEAVLVGRISHVEGQLLRYVPEEDDWVATVQDAPFGMDDALYSNEDGRAEFMMPNNTWMRIDRNTQIQLIVLKDDVTQIDVASGVARFYNKSSYGVIKVTTPFGYVMAPAETSFDLYVGDDSAEVIPLKGKLNFVHHTSETSYEVIAGSTPILADIRQVTAGRGDVDPDWDRWNRKGDALWAERMKVRGESVEYLPPSLHHEAYAFEEHGRWERVYYDGGYYHFWRPVHVRTGWAPFTVGRWTVWYGDQTWIPYEPFGYVTHHYGNWVFVRNAWYWAPPAARFRPRFGPPLLDVGSAWYPGRVAWLHFGTRIGWFPLAPREPYYGYRRWGPRTVVVKNVNIWNIRLRKNKYRHLKQAVIINRHHLHNVNNYRHVRIRHANKNNILQRYRVAPVVNHTVINNYNNIRQRHNFTNVNVIKKPDRKVIQRIRRNHRVAKKGVGVRGEKTQQGVTNIRRGQLLERPKTRTPKVRQGLLSANRVNKPLRQVKRDEIDPRRVIVQPRNQGPAGRASENVSRRVPRKLVRRQAVQRKDSHRTRSQVQTLQRKQRAAPVKTEKARADDSRKNRRKLATVSRPVPHKPARHQQIQQKDSPHARDNLQPVQPRQRPTPVKPKKVRAQNPGRPGKALVRAQKRTRLSVPDQPRRRVKKNLEERQVQKETGLDRPRQELQSARRETTRNAQRQESVVGWTSSKPYTFHQRGTARSSSRFGSMGRRHTRHR